jgi:hypothetical protein
LLGIRIELWTARDDNFCVTGQLYHDRASQESHQRHCCGKGTRVSAKVHYVISTWDTAKSPSRRTLVFDAFGPQINADVPCVMSKPDVSPRQSIFFIVLYIFGKPRGFSKKPRVHVSLFGERLRKCWKSFKTPRRFRTRGQVHDFRPRRFRLWGLEIPPWWSTPSAHIETPKL